MRVTRRGDGQHCAPTAGGRRLPVEVRTDIGAWCHWEQRPGSVLRAFAVERDRGNCTTSGGLCESPKRSGVATLAGTGKSR